jgi:hypothetical protein
MGVLSGTGIARSDEYRLPADRDNAGAQKQGMGGGTEAVQKGPFEEYTKILLCISYRRYTLINFV